MTKASEKLTRFPLLNVKDLAIAFSVEGQEREVVHGVSFTVGRGETVALVGESGSGKSTTALSVLRLLPYPTAYHPSGAVYYEDKNIMRLPGEELRGLRGSKISMIFQEPMSSLNPLHTIEDQVLETILLHQKVSRKEAKEEVLRLLELVSLREAKKRLRDYPHQFSGGERQRVMIAMAIANKPDLLIADEPTTSLDVTIQSQILDLLMDLQKKFGMALLLITHDLRIVQKLAQRVYVMKKGHIVEQGKVEDVFSSPQDAYTQELINSEPKGEPSSLETKGKRPVLDVRNMCVSFQGERRLFFKREEKEVVHDISFSLFKGQTLGILGESGSGKTSLAKAVLSLIPFKGNVQLNGKFVHDISSSDFRKLRKDIQVVFQDPFSSLNPRMTIAQIIGEGLKVHSLSTSKHQEKELIKKTIEEVLLPENVYDAYPHELSGGQRQRVAIARTIILNPEVIILDEPTSALDLSIQSQLIDLLKRIQKKYGTAYIFISHDLKVIKALSHKVLVMKEGKCIESGETYDVFHAPKTLYTKNLIVAAFS